MGKLINWIRVNKFLFSLLLLDLVVILAIILGSAFKGFVEIYYSKGIYPHITYALSGVSDILPLSLTEITFFYILILAIIFLFRFVKSLIKKRGGIKNLLKSAFKTMIIYLSLLFLTFQIFWGFNFHRIPLEERIPFNKENLSKEKLYSTLDKLISRANSLTESKARHRKIINSLINKEIKQVIRNLDSVEINTAQKSKTFLANILMEKMMISGVTSPFFHETHYNKELLPEELPFVLAHEKAHLHGYTGEGEANFIAYLVCQRSADSFIRYSGELSAIRYFLFQTHRLDKEKYNEFKKKLHPEIIKTYRKIAARMKKNRGLLSKFHVKLNDAYLKANQVKGGVDDYSRLVRLILGYSPSERVN